VIETGLPTLNYEEPQVKPDGSIMWVRVSKTPLRDPSGKIIGVLGVYENITDLKKAREELYSSRQMLRLVIDTIPQRVFWKDLDLRYAGYNLAFAQDNGVDDPISLVGKSDYDLARPIDAEIYRAADRKVLESGLPMLNYEEPLNSPDGSVWWVRTSKTLLRDPSGQIIGILGIFEDITAQRLMQIALRESEMRFRTAFEQAAVGMVHLNPQAVFVRVNRRFCKIVGYTEEELLARSFADITHPEDLNDNLANVKGLLNGESSSFSTEKRYIRKDGTSVWANTMVSLMRSEDGSPAYFVAVVEDISARKQAQALLEERTRDLARSNADLEQFAYIASHDLQEPLRMVSSFTQLLERRYKGKLDESADEFIHFIIDGTQRMQRLINDLLIYSRVDTRGNPFRPVSVEDLLAQVTSNLQIAVEESGAQITHDPLPTIRVDQSQFIQLLQNLLGNAIKFHSSAPPHVHLSARLQEKEWVFSVRDNGIGIDAQHYERIFVLFQRLHLHEEYPGTGIGLAVCKKIVERHGGRIWVESTPGQGSTFCFSIPVQQPVDGSIGRAR
jgi:PAS domain S-box-containing protein